jgi:hypothetical protein
MLEITCPSGLRGILREMRVKDQELFANKTLVRNGTVTSKLLENCWENTLNPGPYKFDGKPNWDKMLEADRLYAFIQLRIASLGDEYEFRVICSNCESHLNWQVKLSELNVTPVSDQGKAWINSQIPAEFTLSDGTTVTCRPLIGEDIIFFTEERVPDEEIMTWHLARRITRFGETRMFHDILRHIRELSLRDSDLLGDFTDELEGGVDTTFDVQCKHCKGFQRVILPFDAGFFSSRKRFSDSNRKKSKTR